jgi:hypothetical protein
MRPSSSGDIRHTALSPSHVARAPPSRASAAPSSSPPLAREAKIDHSPSSQGAWEATIDKAFSPPPSSGSLGRQDRPRRLHGQHEDVSEPAGRLPVRRAPPRSILHQRGLYQDVAALLLRDRRTERHAGGSAHQEMRALLPRSLQASSGSLHPVPPEYPAPAISAGLFTPESEPKNAHRPLQQPRNGLSVLAASGLAYTPSPLPPPPPLSPLVSLRHMRAWPRQVFTPAHPCSPLHAPQVQVHSQRRLQRVRQQAQVPLPLRLRRHLGERAPASAPDAGFVFSELQMSVSATGRRGAVPSVTLWAATPPSPPRPATPSRPTCAPTPRRH